jgi:hypothetical protein
MNDEALDALDSLVLRTQGVPLSSFPVRRFSDDEVADLVFKFGKRLPSKPDLPVQLDLFPALRYAVLSDIASGDGLDLSDELLSLLHSSIAALLVELMTKSKLREEGFMCPDLPTEYGRAMAAVALSMFQSCSPPLWLGMSYPEQRVQPKGRLH